MINHAKTANSSKQVAARTAITMVDEAKSGPTAFMGVTCLGNGQNAATANVTAIVYQLRLFSIKNQEGVRTTRIR
jgi:hypothetical protein